MDSSWASSRTEGNFAPCARSPRATASFTAKAICSKRGSAELRSTRRNMAGVPTVLGELVQSREKNEPDGPTTTTTTTTAFGGTRPDRNLSAAIVVDVDVDVVVVVVVVDPTPHPDRPAPHPPSDPNPAR